MKKTAIIFVSLIISLMFSLSVSAGWWSDFFNGITGKAVASVDKSCNDTDGGLQIYKAGSVKYKGRIYYDRCYSNKMQLAEYYCFLNPATKKRAVDSKLYRCKNGCKNNACVENKGITGNAVSSIRACRNSDGGINFDVAGNVTVCTSRKCETYLDACKYGRVYEKYCRNNYVATKSHKCSIGCSGGACISSVNTAK